MSVSTKAVQLLEKALQGRIEEKAQEEGNASTNSSKDAALRQPCAKMLATSIESQLWKVRPCHMFLIHLSSVLSPSKMISLPTVQDCERLFSTLKTLKIETYISGCWMELYHQKSCKFLLYQVTSFEYVFILRNLCIRMSRTHTLLSLSFSLSLSLSLSLYFYMTYFLAC